MVPSFSCSRIGDIKGKVHLFNLFHTNFWSSPRDTETMWWSVMANWVCHLDWKQGVQTKRDLWVCLGGVSRWDGHWNQWEQESRGLSPVWWASSNLPRACIEQKVEEGGIHSFPPASLFELGHFISSSPAPDRFLWFSGLWTWTELHPRLSWVSTGRGKIVGLLILCNCMSKFVAVNLYLYTDKVLCRNGYI